MGLFLNYYFDWDWKYVQFLGRIPNNIATPFVAFAYIGMVMLFIRNNIYNTFQARLQALGKTALTSYLTQSIIATSIFYGFGLGLFGYMNRLSQLLVVLLIWGFLLIICPTWLKRFKYGPIEWIWRILTNMRLISIFK